MMSSAVALSMIIGRCSGLRRGAVSPAFAWFGISLAVLVALIVLLLPKSDQLSYTHVLNLYCAAGLQQPVERVIAEYSTEFGVDVLVQYEGSNTLLSKIELSRKGDLYLSADDSYLQLGREKGLVAEVLPLAQMQVVVGVPRSNPKEIDSLEDLLQPDMRLVVANPDQAAIGKATRDALQAISKWDEIDAHAHHRGVFKPTVGEAANDIKIGSVDAGFLWDAVAAQYDEIDVVHLPELEGATGSVGVGVLTSSKHPTAALHFARYLAARDRGLEVFAEDDYPPVKGDVWIDKPTMTLYAGAINRRALEPIVEAFEAREGVTINTKYNGCGILTAEMQAITGDSSDIFPDAFMACDSYYMETVHDLFQGATTVSSARIVIVVAKDNPKGIHELADLTKPGVKVVLGQPEQCTIGVLSRRLLEAEGVDESALAKNIAAEMPTSAMLVPSITTGSADAALVYVTDAQAEKDRLEIIEIDSPLARAVQPYGIAKSSDHAQLGQRLLEAISKSREHFQSLGFDWRLDDDGEE
ncbi:MAG: extracellular solute-binding protein [Aeoliella sp.]